MILITGASGFIGKHLLEALVVKYGSNQVLALTSEPTTACAYLLHNDYEFERDFFVDNGYDDIRIIIHAGAFIPKNTIQSNLIGFSNSNIWNTQKLLDANLQKLEKIIFLSTVDIYGLDEIISENSIESPVSLYGYSKLYCEKMIEIWSRKNEIKCQILRIGHVYGPGEEKYQKIIPLIMKRALCNEIIQIWGTGEELRSFIFIKDIVTSILNSIALQEDVGVINVVGGRPISINDLVQKIKDLSESELNIEYIQANTTSRNLVFDNFKMRRLLLEQETDFDTGLTAEFIYMKSLNTTS
jgi:UDP-glucose 4-epimerase